LLIGKQRKKSPAAKQKWRKRMGKQVEWMADFKEALKRARKEDKAVLLDFFNAH
jgi:uncharacterized protein YyaL (SSP411 family)